MNYEKGYIEDIDEHFSIHIAKDNDTEEFQELLELNVVVHGEPTRRYLESIVMNHPNHDKIFFCMSRLIEPLVGHPTCHGTIPDYRDHLVFFSLEFLGGRYAQARRNRRAAMTSVKRIIRAF